MEARSLRIGIVLGLAGCLPPVLCQIRTTDIASGPNTSDAQMYASFLQQVVEVKDLQGPVPVNGAPGNLIQPGIQATLGLTEQELGVLIALAVECNTTLRQKEDALRKPMFDARLEAIRTGAIPTDMRQQITELENARDQVVLDYVQRVKSAFGEEKFKKLDVWIRARRGVRIYFPLFAAGESVAVPPVRPQ